MRVRRARLHTTQIGRVAESLGNRRDAGSEPNIAKTKSDLSSQLIVNRDRLGEISEPKTRAPRVSGFDAPLPTNFSC